MSQIKEKQRKKLQSQGYDLEFLARTQPQGNIDFRPDRYYVGGDGYYTILTVYEYPTEALENFWLLDLMHINGARSFLSGFRYDNREIKKALDSSISEKETRISPNQKSTANQQEFDEIYEMKQLHREINKKNIAMNGIYIRIYVTAETIEGLFKKVEEIKEKNSQFKMTILIGELDQEYQAPFVPPSKQVELLNQRRATVIPAYDLAGGYFFKHTKLEDRNGTYYGWTPTNGAVNFNFLERTDKRTRSFMLLSGNPKMGQKTFGLKINDDMYAKGNYIRNFDANGSFNHQTRRQHGLILSLSGKENRINMFQVFPVATNEQGTEVDEILSFQLHVEKLKNQYQMFNSSVTGDDLKIFESALTEFYISHDFWFRNPMKHLHELRITKIANEDCLILSDFISFIQTLEQQALMNHKRSDPYLTQSLQRIRRTFESLLTSHGEIFEGTTQFRDISQEPVVTFDLSGLKGQDAVFNAQVFSALSLISADITNNGKKIKTFFKRILQ